MRSVHGLLLLLVLIASGCATLGQGLLPPRFEVAEDRQGELRLLLPTPARPMGGASVRIWARVQNPNPFGLTLSSVDGNLFMEERQAALVDFPLGLPLGAAQDTVIPLDIGINFADVPALRDVLTRAVVGSPVAYRLDGRMTVEAGVLGRPIFGPMTLLQGEVQTRR
ncbi:MAG TPA: LEA type 2 family protein [Longimicrobiaceae bacterium]|nr:LEA type 2 family protein [Longimicrobiaceae bacterium]